MNDKSAARASQQQDTHERRDRYLHLAQESLPLPVIAKDSKATHPQTEQGACIPLIGFGQGTAWSRGPRS